MFTMTTTCFSYIKPKQIVKYITLKYLEIDEFITDGAFTHSFTHSSSSGSSQMISRVILERFQTLLNKHFKVKAHFMANTWNVFNIIET